MGVRVLVVDDSADIRSLIRALFRLDRPRDVIVEASNAAEALERWRADAPDVIVLDQLLGRDDGLDDVAASILAEQPGLPIVLFTALLDSSIRERAVELGIVACLTQDDLQQLPGLVATLCAAE